MFTTKIPELKPTAANMELAINQIPDEINLGGTLKRMVLEALFSPWGIVKCGLHTVGQALGHDVGSPFVDIVTMDDHFIDMNAKHMDNIDYEGNDYWVDYEEVMESSWANKKALKDLKPDDYTTRGDGGEDRADTVGHKDESETFSDKLWMRDVWLPSEKLLVTMHIKSDRIFKVVEWDEPERGPYYKLGFTDTPGQLLPLPPVGLWRDLHSLGNSLFRKLENQAEGQKAVMAFPGGSNEGAQNFKGAKDGDGITYPAGLKPDMISTPGVDQKTLAFFMQVQQLSSYVAGNLDSLGGLAPQTSTVGQDKLISDSASAQLNGMRDSTVAVSKDIFEALAYYEWNDPIKRRTLDKPIPGMPGQTIPVKFGRKDKKGKLGLYALDIDVFSQQDNSPSIRLQKLMTFVERLVVPLAPMIAQVGGTIDVQEILRQAAKYADMPDASELVTFMDPPSDTVSAPTRSSSLWGATPVGTRQHPAEVERPISPRSINPRL